MTRTEAQNAFAPENEDMKQLRARAAKGNAECRVTVGRLDMQDQEDRLNDAQSLMSRIGSLLNEISYGNLDANVCHNICFLSGAALENTVDGQMEEAVAFVMAMKRSAVAHEAITEPADLTGDESEFVTVPFVGEANT